MATNASANILHLHGFGDSARLSLLRLVDRYSANSRTLFARLMIADSPVHRPSAVQMDTVRLHLEKPQIGHQRLLAHPSVVTFRLVIRGDKRNAPTLTPEAYEEVFMGDGHTRQCCKGCRAYWLSL